MSTNAKFIIAENVVAQVFVHIIFTKAPAVFVRLNLFVTTIVCDIVAETVVVPQFANIIRSAHSAKNAMEDIYYPE